VLGLLWLRMFEVNLRLGRCLPARMSLVRPFLRLLVLLGSLPVRLLRMWSLANMSCLWVELVGLFLCLVRLLLLLWRMVLLRLCPGQLRLLCEVFPCSVGISRRRVFRFVLLLELVDFVICICMNPVLRLMPVVVRWRALVRCRIRMLSAMLLPWLLSLLSLSIRLLFLLSLSVACFCERLILLPGCTCGRCVQMIVSLFLLPVAATRVSCLVECLICFLAWSLSCSC